MTAREVIRTLHRLGFHVERQVGSHMRLVSPGPPRRAVTVSVHAGRDLSDGNIASILRQAGITRDAFERARKEH